MIDAGQSPVLNAHLASFEVSQPSKSRENSQQSNEYAASASAHVLETEDVGEQEKNKVLNFHRPRPVQRLVFDEETAATIPGGDGFGQPWSQEREEQVAKAAEDLQVQRKGKGVAREAGATTGDPGLQEAPALFFMEPKMLDDLPAELKPHFRRIERYGSCFHGKLAQIS